jgi:hypothetical protein
LKKVEEGWVDSVGWIEGRVMIAFKKIEKKILRWRRKDSSKKNGRLGRWEREYGKGGMRGRKELKKGSSRESEKED